MSVETPSQFLFIAGHLRDRSSGDSTKIQLGHGIWGLRTQLIRDNLAKFLTPTSKGLVYVLKVGIAAEFDIVSPVLSFGEMDELIRDEVREEARYGFIRIRPTRQWEQPSPELSLTLLGKVLQVEDRVELTRRLNLGMHGLSDDQIGAILAGLQAESNI